MSKNADIRVIKISKRNRINFYKIKYEKENLFLTAKNINIYNILASLALLKILKLDVKKLLIVSKTFNHLKVEEKSIILKGTKKF